MALPLSMLIPIAIVIIASLLLVWRLYLKNKIFSQKIMQVKDKYLSYEKQAENLKNSRQNPKKDLENLNKLSREFFKEYYKLSYNLTYLELAKRFKKQNKTRQIEFCNLMSNSIYSGKEITAEEIKQLVDLFYEIVLENK